MGPNCTIRSLAELMERTDTTFLARATTHLFQVKTRSAVRTPRQDVVRDHITGARQMRNEVGVTIAAFFGVVALSSAGGAAHAQSQQSEKQFPSSFSQPAEAGYVAAGIPKMPNPPGPAPKHDITGAWAGPIKPTRDPMPPMTPAGEARFKLNKPEQVVHLAATNDTFSTSCDPLGFPRYLYNHAIESRGGMRFEPVQDRMLILMQYQRVWRDVWMDGRQLPKRVDARGFPD